MNIAKTGTVALIAALALFVIPFTVRAEDGFEFGGYDSGFDFGGYDSGFDFGGYDSGFDFGGYDSGYDFGGYDSGFDFGGYDSGFDFGGYDSGFDFGGYDSGFDFGGYAAADVIEEGSDLIYGYTDEYGVTYSYSDSFAQNYSTPSCFTCQSYSPPRASFPSAPFAITAPSYASSAPRPQSYPPSYPPQQPPRPQPQPPITYPPQPSSNLTTNTCVNYSCNSNVNNIDNSINGSFNSTQLAQATPQYLVQYTYPPVVPPAPIYPQQGLYCVITASPSYVQNGQAAILSWTSYGATSAWLSDGIGAVAPNGSLAARPNVSTTYTLTISGYGGTRSCTTYVNVSGAPYVSLSQIPYTGFDLGTFGNAIYWLGLLAFALSGAYLVLYYKGGASVFASSLGIIGNRGIARVRAEKAPAMFGKSAVPAVKTFAPAPVHRAPEDLPMAYTAVSPKDSMTFATSQNGDVPRIVVNRR